MDSLFSAFASISASVVAGILNTIAYAIAWLIGQLIGVASSFTGYAITLNGQIITSEFVKTGWTIARDIANLGFVLVAIIIAIATIVRYKEYTAKNLLVKLIAAAILVNFSLVAAGFLIDFSDVLTNFFLSRIQNGDANSIGSALAGAFTPQALFQPPSNLNSVGNDLGIMLQSFINLGATVAFLTIALVSIAAIGIMFIVRYVHIAFLLILAPILCLFYILPGLGGEASKRLGEFIKWTFFGPAVSFFLYLSLVMAEQLSKSKPAPGDAVSIGMGSIVQTGLQMVVLGSIMLGGLIAANSIGITGAAGAMKLLTGARNGAKALGGKFAKNSAVMAAQSRLGVGTSKVLTNASKNLKIDSTAKTWIGRTASNAGKRLLRGTGAGALAGALAGAAGKTIGKSAAEKPGSLLNGTWKAAKDGSGLFKKEEKKDDKGYKELQEDQKKAVKAKQALQEKGIDTKTMDKEIESIERKMKDAHEDPVDVSGWEQELKRLEDERTKLVSEGFDPKSLTYYDKQISRTENELGKSRENANKKLSARGMVEQELANARTERDEKVTVAGKTYNPADAANVASEAKIEQLRGLVADLQNIEAKKPETKDEWDERISKLKEVESKSVNAQITAEIKKQILRAEDLKEKAAGKEREGSNKKESPKAEVSPKIITENVETSFQNAKKESGGTIIK